MTLLANGHRSGSPYNTVQATFGDAGGSELPYQDLDVDYSSSFIINDVTATRVDGALQEASDATSIDRYGPHGESITDLPLVNDSDALAIAQAIVAKQAAPFTRILSIVLNTAEPAVTEAVFRLDIGSKIRVLRTPPGGGARIDQSLWVQSVKVDADARSPVWKIAFGVSPL